MRDEGEEEAGPPNEGARQLLRLHLVIVVFLREDRGGEAGASTTEGVGIVRFRREG